MCDLSIQSVKNSVNQLLSSLLTTTRLLSEVDFDTNINSSIQRSQIQARQVFYRLSFLLRNIIDGNEITSTYGTNFEYFLPWYTKTVSVAITKGVIYDECSCELNKSCTIQANFIGRSSLQLIQIKGLKMGCTPSESFLSSTLECFYDLLCIDILEKQLTDTRSIDVSQPLLANVSQYSMNTSILDLVNNVFIEKWLTNINYSLYFDQCLPALCSYTYTQQVNSLYTITLLLSIYGGLSVVLKLICPLITLLAAKLYRRWKNRPNIVHPVFTVNGVNSRIVTNGISRRRFIFGFAAFMLVLVTIIVSSVYIFQSNDKQDTSTGTLIVVILNIRD